MVAAYGGPEGWRKQYANKAGYAPAYTDPFEIFGGASMGGPAGLTNFLDPKNPKSTAEYVSNNIMDRDVIRVDLGQGIQDYVVRRDAYGNVKSFTATAAVSPQAMKLMTY
jgi:hypothetical protein